MLPHQNYLLIIDDEQENPSLKEYFAQFNFDIYYSRSLENLPINDKLSAILVSIHLLDHEFHALKKLYFQYSTPIIVIDNQINEEMCINALNAGADDYLIKPLYPRELHARLGAITRRVQNSVKDDSEHCILIFSNWKLYPASRQLFNQDQHEVLLSAGEYELLYAFVKQPQQVLGREFLLQITKNSDLSPFDRRIDVQISRLRQKIEVDAKRPVLIKTIRNEGYILTSSVTLMRK